MEKRTFYCSFSPLTILFIGYLFQTIEFFLIVPTFLLLFAHFQEGFHFRLITSSLLIYYVGLILITPYFGAVSDFFGRRKALIAIQIIRFFSFLICALGYEITSLFVYYLGRFLDGFSGSFSSISSSAIVDIFDSSKDRIRGYTLIQIVNAILMSTFFYVVTTYRTPYIEPVPIPEINYLLAAGISLFVLFIIVTNFPETLPQSHSWKGSWIKVFRGFRKVIKEPQIMKLYLLYFLSISCSTLLFGESSSLSYALLGDTGLLALYACFCLLFASSYWTIPRLMEKYTPKKILQSTLLFLILLNFLILLLPILAPLTLLLSSLPIAIMMTIYVWMIGEIAPSEFVGRSFSLQSALWGMGLVLCYFFPINPLFLFLVPILLLYIFHPRPEISSPIKD